VPPRDPRLCPALDRALPADSPGRDPGYRGERSPWLFLFGDHEWHPVTVRARWTDRHGREVVEIEFRAGGDTYGEAYLAEPEKMREIG